MSAELDVEVSEAEFQRISDVVYKHCGINLHDGKRQLVRARLAKLVRTSGCRNVKQYLDRVLNDVDGDEFTGFIDSLSTNLTSFFRENQHFDYLRSKHLPQIIEKKGRTGARSIRGWSAGCSTGEEPYTVMITLRETIPSFDEWDVKLLATDLSTRVLATAQAGVYEARRLEGVSPQLRGKYFEPRKKDGATAYAVHAKLRQQIRFRYLNLMESWPFRGPFDFIFCRNVMIYFDKPTQERLVNRFQEVLAPGGVLFTGHSESLSGVKHGFSFVQATIYRKG